MEYERISFGSAVPGLQPFHHQTISKAKGKQIRGLNTCSFYSRPLLNDIVQSLLGGAQVAGDPVIPSLAFVHHRSQVGVAWRNDIPDHPKGRIAVLRAVGSQSLHNCMIHYFA